MEVYTQPPETGQDMAVISSNVPTPGVRSQLDIEAKPLDTVKANQGNIMQSK